MTFKEDNEWEFGKYISQINMVYSKVSGAIEKFTKCMDKIEGEDTSDIEIIEDLGTVEIEQHLFDSLISLGENLRNEIFYNSLVTAVYSYLDFGITQFCLLTDEYYNCPRSFEKTPGTGLFKCVNYLKKCFDIKTNNIEEWDDIDKFRRLRNLIVHHNSNIIKNPEKGLSRQPHYKKLIDIEHLEITESGYVFIKDIEYIESMLERSSSFINNIILEFE